MTKKRIADLLKEEVEKPAEGKPQTGTAGGESATKARTRKRASAKSTTAKSTAAKSTAAKSTAAKSTAAKSTAKASSTASSAAKSSAASSAAKSSAAKATVTAKADTAKTAAKEHADLSKKVAELETALQKSEAQISALQEDVDTHQSRIFELKDSLEKTESDGKQKDTQLKKLTAELAEAKQVILNLSKPEPPAPAEVAAKEDAAPLAKVEPTRQSLSVRRRPYSSYKSIPEYAIQRGTPVGGQNNSMLNDDDIGWVD